MKLLAKLSDLLGHHAAKQEFRWMQQKSSHHATLEKMLERRLQGEPLQYILGAFHTYPSGASRSRILILSRPNPDTIKRNTAIRASRVACTATGPHSSSGDGRLDDEARQIDPTHPRTADQASGPVHRHGVYTSFALPSMATRERTRSRRRHCGRSHPACNGQCNTHRYPPGER